MFCANISPLTLPTLFYHMLLPPSTLLPDPVICHAQCSSLRWEPQISVLCEAGQAYHPQHLSEEGRWTTDLNIKSAGNTCLRDKIDLLEQCKRVSALLNI